MARALSLTWAVYSQFPLLPFGQWQRGRSRILAVSLASIESSPLCRGKESGSSESWCLWSSERGLSFGKQTRVRAAEVGGPPKVREMVQLTDKERLIFEKLLGTLKHNQLDTQLRVAGGWVRDKVCE